MIVKELIHRLEDMPNDMEVKHIWDGEARTNIEFCWVTKDGFVATADCNEVVYSTGNRPISAPTEEKMKFWYTPTERRK